MLGTLLIIAAVLMLWDGITVHRALNKLEEQVEELQDGLDQLEK